jgi:hypothetical protein
MRLPATACGGRFEGFSTVESALVPADSGHVVGTVNLLVFRRHPCGAQAFGSACKSGVIPRPEKEFRHPQAPVDSLHRVIHKLTAADVPIGGAWQEFQFFGVGVPAIGCTAMTCTPSSAGNSVFAPAPPWTFVAGETGVRLTVTDAFLLGDRFEVFDSGVSLGETSAVPVGGACGSDPVPCLASASNATFALGEGSHSITITPTASPFGGGAAYFLITALTADDCKNGGWQTFANGFKNQGDCVSFVATGGRNEADPR